VAAILLTGSISTIRKSAAIVPVAAILTLLAFRPRELLRLWPAGLVVLILMPAMAPGAAGQVKSQLSSIGARQSTQGRTADYDAIQPDLLAHRTIGRGYGTYDHDRYRLLDNQYLGVLIGTGLVGLATFIAMILAVVLIAIRPIRSRDPVRGPPALAAAAAAVAFGIVAALFDALAFPQTPYLFFFVAAIAVVAASRDKNDLATPAEGRAGAQTTARLYAFADPQRSERA
jgi:O-antigen ligase